MSNTFKTKPIRARFLEKGIAKEYHNHQVNECTLIPIKDWIKGDYFGWAGSPDHPCGWEARDSFLNEHHICGCPMCTDQVGRKMKARKIRHSKKKEVNKNLEEYADENREDQA
jgi:hypothetical protein